MSHTSRTLEAQTHFFFLSVLFHMDRKCDGDIHEAAKPLKRGIGVHFVQTLLNSSENYKVSGT